MPLPRLGCGGPSRDVSDEKHVLTEAQLESPCIADRAKKQMPCTNTPEPNQLPLPVLEKESPMKSHGQMPAEPDQLEVTNLPKLNEGQVHQEPCEPSDHCSELHKAMPLPRPGCGGSLPDEPQVTKLPVHVPCHSADVTHLKCVSQPKTSNSSDQAFVPTPDHASEASSAMMHFAKLPEPSETPSHDPIPPFQAKPLPRLGCGGPPHADDKDRNVDEELDEDTTISELMVIFMKHPEALHPKPFLVDSQTTPRKLTHAEAKLRTMKLPIAPRSLVGTHLQLDTPLQQHQYALLHETLPKQMKCPFLSTKYTENANLPMLQMPCTRFEALWNQQAWVARDEMTYYLEATQYCNQANPFPPTTFHCETAANEWADEWLAIAIGATDTDRPWCSAAIVTAHWIPVVIFQDLTTIRLLTTPEGSCFIPAATRLAHGLGKTLEVSQRLLPQNFPGDCGFQSLAWLIAMINGMEVEALSPHKAEQWRHLFVRELCRQGTGHDIIHHLDIGGAQLDSQEIHQLSTLLSQHGVWSERVADRANQVVSTIPAATIRSALRASRPWQDLKAAANLVKPQLKLIMLDELNAQIAQRTNQRKYGKKSQASKRHEAGRDHITIQASELVVPHGVFKQQDNTVLGPLQV